MDKIYPLVFEFTMTGLAIGFTLEVLEAIKIRNKSSIFTGVGMSMITWSLSFAGAKAMYDDLPKFNEKKNENIKKD